MGGRYSISVTFLVVVIDLLFINSLYFVLQYFFPVNTSSAYTTTHLLINLGYIVSTVPLKINIYNKHLRTIVTKNLYRIIITTCIVFGCLFTLKISEQISRLFIFSFFGISFFVLSSIHWFVQRTSKKLIKKKKFNENAIILGAGLIGNKIYQELLTDPYSGIHVLGFFDDDQDKNNGKLCGTIQDAKSYAKANNVSKIYCTLPVSASQTILDFIEFSENNVISFHIVPTIGYYSNTPNIVLEMVGNMPVFSMRKIPLSYVHNAFLKRSFDLIVSFLFLTTLFPFLYIIIGIAIKLSSRGTVFFVQERTGKGGKKFKCYKFRSMYCNSESNSKQATIDDSRKTRIGRFLRRTNFDELPQFINVLKGDMSIVGPRPHMLLHTEEYSNLVQKYMVRHFIKPGITGWAQVNGFRGEIKEVSQLAGRILRDIWYLENWSLSLDIEIIIKTILVTIKGDKQAY